MTEALIYADPDVLYLRALALWRWYYQTTTAREREIHAERTGAHAYMLVSAHARRCMISITDVRYLIEIPEDTWQAAKDAALVEFRDD